MIFGTILEIVRAAWAQPYMPLLTVAFFLCATMGAVVRRRKYADERGHLPPVVTELPAWYSIPIALYAVLFFIIILMNFWFGIMIWAVGFALAYTGVLDRIGYFLWLPFPGGKYISPEKARQRAIELFYIKPEDRVEVRRVHAIH